VKAAITSTGRFFPDKEVPNSYFYEDLGLDTSDEWIVSRTGIKTRRLCDPARGEVASTMAMAATRACLERVGMEASELDAIVVATVTPDQRLPSTAAFVQDGLGARNLWAFDLHAACSGFVYSVDLAASMVESGRARRVMVIGVDHMSSILDFTDRNSCILFGDGAGATLIEAVPDDHPGAIGRSILRTDGSGACFLEIPAGGGRVPLTTQVLKEHMHYVRQDGRTVFKHAVSRIVEVVRQVMEADGMTIDDIDLFVPHQANVRILKAAADRLKVPWEKVMITIDRFANTTAASIPTSLDIAYDEGRLKTGDTLLFAAFGAGFTWGAQWLTWGGP
jgi:3-oxoacyl-[acyl-carrier-protein] synthase-3